MWRSTGRRLIIKEEMMKTTIVCVVCFGLALSGITAQETETEMEVGAAADGAETYLVSAVTADDRLHMAATAATSHSFAPLDGEIELIEIRAFSAPPAHTDETRAEYATVEGQDLIGFTGGYLSAPVDPAAEEIVHQSIQIVEWVDGEAASVEAEAGVERAEPVTERAEPEAEVERAEPKAEAEVETERPGEE
jgi:hypothetical protein